MFPIVMFISIKPSLQSFPLLLVFLFLAHGHGSISLLWNQEQEDVVGDIEVLEDFEEFAELMREEFIVNVCHVYREANFVSHSLAHLGVSSCVFSCYTPNFPV